MYKSAFDDSRFLDPIKVALCPIPSIARTHLSIMVLFRASTAALLAAAPSLSYAQSFQRLGTCPTLGCILPPDQQDFLAGQYFDIRLEVHAPVNGSEATNGEPDEDFAFTISKAGSEAYPATKFFGLEEPELESWSFSWYEDLFAYGK